MIKYRVGNLTCSNCASKIEKAVSNLPDVKGASINLMGESIHIDTEHDSSELLSNVQNLADSIEPGTTITKIDDEHVHHADERHLWFDLGISLLLFIMGLGNIFGLGTYFYVAAFLL